MNDPVELGSVAGAGNSALDAMAAKADGDAGVAVLKKGLDAAAGQAADLVDTVLAKNPAFAAQTGVGGRLDVRL
jgi:hypothetical protein